MKKQTIFDMTAFLGSMIFWSWIYMRFFYAYVAVVFYKNQPEWNLLIPASIILTLTAKIGRASSPLRDSCRG